MQNKNGSKVSELSTRPLCRNSNKLSNNCQVKRRIKTCVVSNSKCGLGNKCKPKTVQLCQENSKIQTDSLFEDVKKLLVCSNCQTIIHSAVNKDGSQLDNNCTKDMVTESSNTQFSTSKHVFINARKKQ